VVDLPNLWHNEIGKICFAGRSEAFMTGNVGQIHYCDVASLYPVSLIQTQALLICDVSEFQTEQTIKDKLLGKASWQIFYGVTGKPYGWILGDFASQDDLWGLPIEQGANNWYVTGTLRNRLYHTLDLEASNAEILRVDYVLIPVFDTSQPSIDRMSKYETLTDKKLSHKCESELEEKCVKMTTNSAHGTLGQSHPDFAAHTNLPAYNTVLAQSHLFMSELFHKYSPVLYTDTDSFFVVKRVEGLIRECSPYPSLPFQRLKTVPLKVDVKAQSKPTGAVIFRGKMYGGLTFEGADINAFSAWHPKADNFAEILAAKPTQSVTVEQQTSRKWLTKNKAARRLRVGGFYVQTVEWDYEQLHHIFRADSKRKRDNPDSYQLFLDNKSSGSRSWTITEAMRQFALTKWHADFESGRMTLQQYETTALLANINADFGRVFAEK
ncbi:hypothetical protein MUP77_16700, partial [Candidatus Bathyarchaeota archaeon]|nr:hypothetical protein [Candidatus Bathyarchaeota archaeon]